MGALHRIGTGRAPLVAGVVVVAATAGALIVRDRLRAPPPDLGRPSPIHAELRRGEHGGYYMLMRYRTPTDALAEDDAHIGGTRIKLACRVGEQVLVATSLWLNRAGLIDRGLPEGVSEMLGFDYYELPSPPSRCQVEFHKLSDFSDTGAVGTFCLDEDGDPSPGPCAPPVVTHPPPGPDPVVSDVAVTRDPDGDVVVRWTTTAARPPVAGFGVDVAVHCRSPEGELDGESGCLDIDQLGPGEALQCAQIVLHGGAPSTCEVSFYTTHHADRDRAPFAVFCAAVDGKTQPRACGG